MYQYCPRLSLEIRGTERTPENVTIVVIPRCPTTKLTLKISSGDINLFCIIIYGVNNSKCHFNPLYAHNLKPFYKLYGCKKKCRTCVDLDSDVNHWKLFCSAGSLWRRGRYATWQQERVPCTESDGPHVVAERSAHA